MALITNPIRVLSKDNPEDIEILLSLTHMREGGQDSKHRVTCCAPAKIEEVFGDVMFFNYANCF